MFLEGVIVFCIAFQEGYDEVVQILFEYDVDMNYVDKFGRILM